MLSTTFHTNLTGRNLKVLNILFFKFQTQLFTLMAIFTNYETDNIKEIIIIIIIIIIIFIQDCCISLKKKTAINAGPVKKIWMKNKLQKQNKIN